MANLVVIRNEEPAQHIRLCESELNAIDRLVIKHNDEVWLCDTNRSTPIVKMA